MTEKQEKIRDAAAMVFAKYGYKKTTIDEIVATAGISKGLYYHYYPDKKTLYMELYNTTVTLMDDMIREKTDFTVTDFLERLKQISHIRIEFINEHRNLWGFLYSAYYEQHPDIAPLIREQNAILLAASSTGSAANIDWSKLKKGISKDKALQLVTWIAEGYVSKVNENKLEYSSNIYREFDEYIDLLRGGIYDVN